MKTLWVFIVAVMCLWCSPASAEYCSVQSEGKKISCTYKIDHLPKNTQIIISYTRHGWSMMIAVFLEEFANIEGDAKVKTKKGEMQSLEYISTQRDMTESGLMMEVPVYLVSEALLRELGNSSGRIQFLLPAMYAKHGEVELKIHASLFSDIDEYIAETKSVLGVLFENE